MVHINGSEYNMTTSIELNGSIATFVQERIEFTSDDKDRISKRGLYIAYKNWWMQEHETKTVVRLVPRLRFSEILNNDPKMVEGSHRKDRPREWKRIRIISKK